MFTGLYFQEGNWVWERTKEPMGYTNWKLGEPNNVFSDGSIENCLHLTSKSYGMESQWNDFPCSYNQWFKMFRPLCQLFNE